MSCDACRMAGPDIADKTKFVTGKKKFKSQKNEKWYPQKLIP